MLASFLAKRFELSQIISEENMLDNVLNSIDIRREIREAVGLTIPQFNILVSKMKRAGVMNGNKIDKHYIPNIQKDTNQYRLTLIFDIDDKYKVDGEVSRAKPAGDVEDNCKEAESPSPGSDVSL